MASEHLVSVEWLAEHIHDPNVVIVDCRFDLANPQLGRQQYKEGHIPGAFYLDLNQDLSSPVAAHGGRHPLPDVEVFAATLARLGIQSGVPGAPNTRVVAYDASRFAFAARLWWLLRYIGHDEVAVLDGGFPAWQAAGKPVTVDVRSPQVGQVIPQARSHWLRTVEDVEVHLNTSSTVLIDSREAARYRGEQEPIDPIAGHIPGAINYPWQGVTDEQGYAQAIAAQKQRWEPLPAEANITVYCGSGVTACVNLLSLELAGRSGATLYAGSWSDWCSYPHTPKATAP